MPQDWNGETVRQWLESRILAARANQITAERSGRSGQDDCDVGAAEEMVCATLKRLNATNMQNEFVDALKTLLDRDEFVWRGVYNDSRFDRHVRTYIRKLIKMAKANVGFGNTSHYQ